jgi:hypothetical protein
MLQPKEQYVFVWRYPSNDGLRIKTHGGTEFSRHVFAGGGVINKQVLNAF